jgi:putative transposase
MTSIGEGEGEEGRGRSVSGEVESEVRGVALTREETERVGAMQWIGSAPDRESYGERQREVAKQLKMTVRNVQYLMRAWERGGVSGVIRQGRSDRGKRRLDEEWAEYIVQTYRAGNRGGRRMSRAQVAVRVAARAIEKGESQPPSRTTVYRVLASEIEQKQQRQRARSIVGKERA